MSVEICFQFTCYLPLLSPLFSSVKQDCSTGCQSVVANMRYTDEEFFKRLDEIEDAPDSDLDNFIAQINANPPYSSEAPSIAQASQPQSETTRFVLFIINNRGDCLTSVPTQTTFSWHDITRATAAVY